MKCLTLFACLFAFATAQNLRGLQAIDDYDPNDPNDVDYSNGGTQNNDYPQTTEEPPKGKMKIYGDDAYEPVYTAEQQKRLGVDKFGNSYGAGKNPMNPGQKKPQQSKNKWGQKGNSQQQQWGQKQQQWGQKGNSQKQQWGQKGNSQQQWGQKGNSQQQQNKNRWSQKGKWTQQFYNKEHKCTVTKIPANLQTQYKSEFKALDVDNNGYLDSKEFKDEGAKISDAFSNFRKGKKPTWYNKGHKNGNNNQNGGRGGNQNGGRGGYGRGNQNGGQNNQNGGGFGGFGRGGNQNGGQHNQHGGRGRGRGGRQLADKSGSNFWEYLQHQGFVSQKPKQSTKDRMDSRRAAQVFKKFDQDHNNKVSLCEYENAMYRTEMLEKRMSGKKNNGIVVVHG